MLYSHREKETAKRRTILDKGQLGRPKISSIKGKNKRISGLKSWVFSLKCWRPLLEEM
jgi:hypothetical protein